MYFQKYKNKERDENHKLDKCPDKHAKCDMKVNFEILGEIEFDGDNMR